RALAIAESVWGLDHPETATVATNLAPLLIASGESARARMLLEQALVGQERLLGASHPSLSMTHMQLGLVALNDGDIGRGIAELEKCVAGRRADPPTATGAICRLNLAQARLLVGGCASALPELRGVAQEFTALQKGNEHDREIAIALLTEAGCEIDSEPRKADAALARVEETVPAVADPTMHAETKLMRAHIRWTRGEHDEARALARAARAALATPGATDPEIIAMGGSEQSLIRRIDDWLAEH
ncbi:MAG TPA: tetratricopeptide repeat protein, partial [Nannocystaceae bacterium]|nr:tetratricopeptide repeat protein [Nannocystaceae bacterium]